MKRMVYLRSPYTCMYNSIWNPAVGEVLVYKKEPHNEADRYYVAIRCQKIFVLFILGYQRAI